MSIGFVTTVFVLALILGVLGKQTLSPAAKPDEQKKAEEQNHYQAM